MLILMLAPLMYYIKYWIIAIPLFFFAELFLLVVAGAVTLSINLSLKSSQKSLLREYRGYFKKAILPGILSTVNRSFEYRPDRHIDLYEFLELGIYGYPGIVPVIGGEDYFSGHVERTKIEFSEVMLSYVNVIENGQQVPINERKNGFVFKGLIFKADFNKHFHGLTRILSKSDKTFTKAIRAISDFRKKTTEPGSDLANVATENLEFNKHFEVVATDGVEARYILSLKLMELILLLKERFENARMDIVMQNHSMYIAVNWMKDLFEPPALHINLRENQQQLQIYARQIQLCCNLVDALDLNTRIWTKS